MNAAPAIFLGLSIVALAGPARAQDEAAADLF